MAFVANDASHGHGGSDNPATLQQVSGFGNNPTGIGMYIYVPNRLATNPAIVVALHPCGGSAQQFYSSNNLPSYADSNGFIFIYPQTTAYSNCWDVNNPGSLTHGWSGDATGIISMINYTLNRFNGKKVKAGAAYSGVAFACFAGSTTPPTPAGSNQTCAQGLQHTPQEWANFVRNAYPGYNCECEQLKQWSAVLGLTNTNNVTGSSVPEGPQYMQINYGDGSQLVGYFGQGVGHYAPPNPR
ncbi:putative feruloyl esterase B [Staphylotrichum tortipilum]|uniref:Feruloyl esterase B n=1 Tax=Staphylotrichum tortipilum TaxID=2831512 RepID=A0AAN6RP85_9PEZI|nr:putative feruloyl esterase B [Staphylotrichum longicolle]